jgi:TM2 domain-containing membrane protein YozV
MKKFVKLFTLLSLGFIFLSSFSIAPKTDPTNDPKVAALSSAIDAAKLDGKVTKSELKNIATIAKGSKLSFKEKVVLKFFGKKLSSRIMDMDTSSASDKGKSQVIALLLCIFVGGIGIHRFYLGYTWQGIVQILTLGGLGIWWLVDLIRIITGDLKPKDGEYETKL